MVFASKELSEEEWMNFDAEFKEAELDMKNREIREEECIEELEKNMTLACITGVEDMLQDNVKDCIMHLREAGIKGRHRKDLINSVDAYRRQVGNSQMHWRVHWLQVRVSILLRNLHRR